MVDASIETPGQREECQIFQMVRFRGSKQMCSATPVVGYDGHLVPGFQEEVMEELARLSLGGGQGQQRNA